MDYEKKNEALDIVRQMVKDGQIAQDAAEKYFPEIKESEDEKIRKMIIEIVKRDEERIGVNAHLKKLQWLEKQKPVEWSEEDERMLGTISDLLYSAYIVSDGNPTWGEIRDWMQSFRNRKHPQKHWKPSEEQIAAIEYIIKRHESTNISLYKGAAKQLYSLLEQLKAL